MNTSVDEAVLSEVERVKHESGGLRGTLPGELAADTTHLSEEAKQLLKFHGSYEQEDRDQRRDRKKAGLEPAYSYMVRSKLPGGTMYGGPVPGAGRAGRPVRRRYPSRHHAAGLPVLRHRQERPARHHPRPEPGAGHHLWRLRRRGAQRGELLRAGGGDAAGPGGGVGAPALGRAAAAHAGLPRDLGGGEPGDGGRGRRWTTRCTERSTCRASSRLPSPSPTTTARTCSPTTWGWWCWRTATASRGSTWWWAGGWGRRTTSPRPTRGWPAPWGSCSPEELLEVARAIIGVQRDHGNRTNRKRARLKYLLDEQGVDWFRGEVEAALGRPLAPYREVEVTGYPRPPGVARPGGRPLVPRGVDRERPHPRRGGAAPAHGAAPRGARVGPQTSI